MGSYERAMQKWFMEHFEKWKKEEFSKYCLEKCNGSCCNLKDVCIHVTESEIEAMFGGSADKDDFPHSEFEGRVIVSGITCQQYDPKSHGCKIWGENKRPKGCSEYPFIVGIESILIYPSCQFEASDPVFASLVKLAADFGLSVAKLKDPDSPSTTFNY